MHGNEVSRIIIEMNELGGRKSASVSPSRKRELPDPIESSVDIAWSCGGAHTAILLRPSCPDVTAMP